MRTHIPKPFPHNWVSPKASRHQSSSQVHCWTRKMDNRLSFYCYSFKGKNTQLVIAVEQLDSLRLWGINSLHITESLFYFSCICPHKLELNLGIVYSLLDFLLKRKSLSWPDFLVVASRVKLLRTLGRRHTQGQYYGEQGQRAVDPRLSY